MKKLAIIFCTFILSLPLALTCHAASLTLAWDASPSADVVGYKLYYKVADAESYNGVGIQQGNSPIDVGSQLSIDLDGLADSTLYTFTVTSYDSTGVESVYSNAVSLTTDAADTGTTPSLFIPALFYPANQATGLPSNITFDWNDPSDGRAVNYTLVFGTDPNLADNTVAAVALPGQHSGVPLSAPPTVALFALLGLAIPGRKRVKGTVAALLLGATLVLSACGGGGGADGALSSPSNDQTGSQVAVPTNSIANISTSSFEISDFQPGTTYYWKVIADDGVNVTSSDIHSFTTAVN